MTNRPGNPPVRQSRHDGADLTTATTGAAAPCSTKMAFTPEQEAEILKRWKAAKA
ncbi:hypothetical protein [Roseateles sp. P5_E1]